jgi:alpha-beta hydrolase superfamily lysophospholipase
MAQTESVQNVVYQEDGTLSQQAGVPTYEWFVQDQPCRGVVLAVHGVTMHGRSFDYLGKSLAQQGYHVVALDLRGYGRSFYEGDGTKRSKGEAKSTKDCDNRAKVNYEKSADDVVRVARALKSRFPGQPVFGLGESLGTHMVIRLAAEHPELCDGLVLSAPSVRRHQMLDPYVAINAGLFCVNPRAQLDLMPFVRKYASDDPRVVAEKETDPLLRRKMSVSELLKATTAIRKTINWVPKINEDTPVLVIQGGGDRVLHADAVVTLLSKLHAKDQTVKWFAERGHILLETEYIKPDTMDAVVSWLNTHVQSAEMQSKVQHEPNYVAQKVDESSAFQRASFAVKLDE